MHSNLLRAALLAVLSALVLALAACGGEDDPEETTDLGPDPVAMAPADAPFYSEVVVRPEGSLGEDLDAALGKLIGEEDPGAKIREAIDGELAADPDSADFTYAEDIESWLGSRAGVFVSDFDGTTEEVDFGVALPVTDADAAQAFLDKAEAAAGDSTPTEETYEGVDYKLDSSGEAAYGIVGDFLLIGNQQGFEDAVDASAGDSLADNPDATTALADAPENSLFSLYVDTPAIVELIKSSGRLTNAEIDQIDQQLAQYDDGPIEAWGTVTDSTFALGGSAPTPPNAAEPSELVSGFPDGAWLAFASASFGEQLTNGIKQAQAGLEEQLQGLQGLQGLKGSGIKPSSIDPFARLRKETGINLATDLRWIGDVGGFVQGTSLLGLGGGLVIEATDEAAASKALTNLQAALVKSRELRGQVEITPSTSGEGFSVQAAGGIPVRAEVVLQDGQVVVGLGADSAEDVLTPDETLEGSDRFNAANAALGEGAVPSFFLDFAPIIDLVESSGQLSADPDYALVKPYLDALDYIVSGSAVEGDRTSGNLVLGVKEADTSSAETETTATSEETTETAADTTVTAPEDVTAP